LNPLAALALGMTARLLLHLYLQRKEREADRIAGLCPPVRCSTCGQTAPPAARGCRHCGAALASSPLPARLALEGSNDPAGFRAELIEAGPLRRVWRLSGPCEIALEWRMDRGRWGDVSDLERVLVDGRVAWRDLAAGAGKAEFDIPCPQGPVWARLGHCLDGHTVNALYLIIDGALAYVEGDVEGWFPRLTESLRGFSSLPLPAEPPVNEIPTLPIPGERQV